MDHLPMKNLIAFLFGWLIAAAILIPQAHAAVSVRPTVPGYSAGLYSAASGSFTTAANAASYGASGVVSVGGKAITMPATLRMAANAGQFAKNAMRLNPWGIAGTLAAGWLLDHLMSTDGSTWYTVVQPYYDTGTQQLHPSLDALFAARRTGSVTDVRCRPGDDAGNGCYLDVYSSTYSSWSQTTSQALPQGAPVLEPADEQDWDNLPDPLPFVAPELPYAPYMPEGVPVDAPSYDFAPYSVPVGEPYSKPDGSTAQPMARVSPNGDSVTIDTYDQPLTDTSGQPVPNPTPQDTPEPSPSECERHPSTIGCAEFGTAAPEVVPTTVIPVNPSVVPVGGAGSCPADITTSIYGLTWSYQPICDFASAIRPLIIGFAWLAFAYIVAGTVRT